ncbi:MAG: nucleotidyl transferase AbiEii/AbiGii toxin family protein, partial [Boseongicola sp. SB0673_bin_14]|nr:nucleotidyl transferase AbiEii/AbiGii toxin family protein [Boseongicola sp. SB0673_bin_14]
MDRFASDGAEQRDEAFQEAAARLGMSKAIIEKDFWVCWSLKQLFALPSFGDHMIFKGGTALSKVYDPIHRFAEDVALSLKPAMLGYEG